MKRTTAFLLALTLMLSLALPALAVEAPALTLTADKTSLAPGQAVSVTLTLDQALSGLNNYQFNVRYDAARFVLTGSTVEAAPTVVSSPRKDERTGTDCITVSGLSTEGLAVDLAAGTVAVLTFTALDTAELGDAEFAVAVQALPDYGDPTRTVELTVVNNAKITLGEAPAVMPGDFNGDGSLKLTDYLLCFYAYKSSRALTETEAAAADTNGNGTIGLAEALRVFYLYKQS